MINDNVPIPFLIVFFTLFPVIWLTVIVLLRKKSGMAKALDFELGQKIKSSGWGSAVINEVPAKNCVCVDEYSGGYLIRMMSLFGGGKLWLPKSELTVIKEKEGSLFYPGYKEIKCETDHVRLFGKLGEMIDT